MAKKTIIFVLSVVVFTFVSAGLGLATEMGPAEIKLTSSDSTKKPPSVFPHKAHQDVLKCGDCHHGMADGKQIPYVDGQEVKKCESCHNPEILGGKTKGKNKLDTFKGAGHGNCLDCHKEIAKKDDSKKNLKSCKTCHVK